TLTINDNDSAPTFSINDVTHNEGNAGPASFTFTVTKTGTTALTSTVQYVTQDGSATAPSDYTAITGTNVLSFAPADTAKMITVLVNGDTTPELDESFNVKLSNAVNATISNDTGAAR